MIGISLDKFISIVRKAGDAIVSVDAEDGVVAKPGTANFVTQYDKKTQQYLVTELTKLLPGSNFMGEEDGLTPNDVHSGYVWIIDPIDGTTNFLSDFKYSAVCVGLALDGKIIMGAIYNPFQKEMFYAQKGKGAFLNGDRIHMTDKNLSEGVIIFDASPYNPELRHKSLEIVEELSYKARDIRSLGSAALSFCYVACGRAVLYMSQLLYTWDYAAASLIVEEAGGKLCGFDGKDLELKNHCPVTAGTPKALAEFLKLLKLKNA